MRKIGVDHNSSGLEGLRFPKCQNLLGTVVEGTIVPNGEHNLPPPKSTNTTISLPTELTHSFTTSGPFHLRPVVHPFTRHNDLPHIYTLPCLPLGYNNVNVNVAGNKAPGISSACMVQHTLHRKHAHAGTKDAKATTVDADICETPEHRMAWPVH